MIKKKPSKDSARTWEATGTVVGSKVILDDGRELKLRKVPDGSTVIIYESEK